MFKEVSVVAIGVKNSDMLESKQEQYWVSTNALKRYMVGKTAFPSLLRPEGNSQRTQYP